jgi:purine-binding chemotaxis protein CheW
VNAAARELTRAERWVVFTLAGRRFALPLDNVVRVLRAAEITALPRAPGIVAGVVDIRGHILPVFNLRSRLALPERPLSRSDQFILARTSRRDVVLLVDGTQGLVEAPARRLDASPVAPGALALPDGLVLIEDLERFLTPDEERALEAALDETEVRVAP